MLKTYTSFEATIHGSKLLSQKKLVQETSPVAFEATAVGAKSVLARLVCYTLAAVHLLGFPLARTDTLRAHGTYTCAVFVLAQAGVGSERVAEPPRMTQPRLANHEGVRRRAAEKKNQKENRRAVEERTNPRHRRRSYRLFCRRRRRRRRSCERAVVIQCPRFFTRVVVLSNFAKKIEGGGVRTTSGAGVCV